MKLDMDKERREFEAWANEWHEDIRRCGDNGGYMAYSVHSAWRAWLAAKRSMSTHEAGKVYMVCLSNINGPSDIGKWQEATEVAYNTFSPDRRRILYTAPINAEAIRDAERLDWLEAQINAEGAIHLHDDTKPYGNGLGLRPGSARRSLREAIDDALQSSKQEEKGAA